MYILSETRKYYLGLYFFIILICYSEKNSNANIGTYVEFVTAGFHQNVTISRVRMLTYYD